MLYWQYYYRTYGTRGCNVTEARNGKPNQDRRAHSTTSDTRARTYLISGGVILVIISAAIAIGLSSGSGDGASARKGTGAYAASRADREQAPVTVTGSALSPYPDVPPGLIPEGQDRAVGETPPKLEGTTFDGGRVVIDPADGRAKVVMFIAHWCPHCQNEVPVIQRWINDGDTPQDVDFYAVSTAVTSSRPNYPPSKWIEREGFTPPVLLDNADSSAAAAWALPGYPYFVALNSDGSLARRGNGEIPISEIADVVGDLT